MPSLPWPSTGKKSMAKLFVLIWPVMPKRYTAPPHGVSVPARPNTNTFFFFFFLSLLLFSSLSFSPLCIHLSSSSYFSCLLLTQHDDSRSAFLGSLPYDVTEDEIRDHFAGCGDIESVRLVRDKKTNVGKGFGFILFHVR